MKNIVVGVTGASGILYAKRLLEALKQAKAEVFLIISDTARTVAKLEEVDLSGYPVHYEENLDLEAGIASGSFQFDAMVIVPCSMKSLAQIANGYSTTLIARAADVCLKERDPLILVPRETPYSRVHRRQHARGPRCRRPDPARPPAVYTSRETLDGELQKSCSCKVIHSHECSGFSSAMTSSGKQEHRSAIRPT